MEDEKEEEIQAYICIPSFTDVSYLWQIPPPRKGISFLPDKFHSYFRMTGAQFVYVLGLIDYDIRKEDTNWRKAITPRERLAICLR